jgi:hypothetical protein
MVAGSVERLVGDSEGTPEAIGAGLEVLPS